MQKLYYPQDPPLESPLEKLPEEQVLNIFNDYLNPDISVSQIIENLSVSKSTLYPSLPFILSERSCEKCGEPIYIKPQKRTAQNPDKIHRYCTQCGHNYTESCDCKACLNKREQRQREQEERDKKHRSEFEKKWKNWVDKERPQPYQISEISLIEEIYLYLILAENTFNPSCIEAYEKTKRDEILFIDQLTEETQNYVKNLIDRNVLVPSYSPNFEAYNEIDLNSTLEFNQKSNTQFNINFDSSYTPPIFGTKWIINTIDFLDLDTVFKKFKDKKYTQKEKKELFYRVYRREIRSYLKEINKYLDDHLELDLLEGLIYELFLNFPLAKAFHLIRTTASSTISHQTTESSEPVDITKFFLVELHKTITKNIGNPNTPEYRRTKNNALPKLEQHIIYDILGQHGSYDRLNLTRVLHSSHSKKIPEKVVIDELEDDPVPF